jgi:hypothetical protein
MYINTREDNKIYMENCVYGGCVKIIAISGNYKVTVRVYFVPEGHITPSLTTIIGQLMTERNVSLFSAEQENDHYDALLQAEKKD